MGQLIVQIKDTTTEALQALALFEQVSVDEFLDNKLSRLTEERALLKKKEDLTTYFMKLREKTQFSLGKVTWSEEDLYD